MTMEAKHLCLLLLAFVPFTTVRGQNGDDLPIPMENDNQFPPEQQAAPSDGDMLEGSGIGAIPPPETEDKPSSTTTEQPPIEDILSGTSQLLIEQDSADNKDNPDSQLSCPEKCLCNVEGDDFTTDCSGAELTIFPETIDLKTTKLKLQNNKLTEIPKEISTLTNLKVLNASGNLIQDLALGSISTLSGLLVLDLQNNRMLQFPMDLKNSFGLTKLETLNLGGNDIREPLESDALGKFTSLQNIVVPANAFDEEVEAGLCKSLASSLKIICVDTCEKEKTCPDSLDDIENDFIDAQIPGAIFSDNEEEIDIEPTVDTPEINGVHNEMPISVDNETPLENEVNEKDLNISETSPVKEFSSRSDIKEPETGSSNIMPETAYSPVKTDEATAISRFSTLVEADNSDEPRGKLNIPAEPASKQKEAKPDTNDSSNYKVGATTADSKTGGVNKSIIGIIVAGMVVVVAGITIKKNWTAIRKRFSSNSNSRTPDRQQTAGNANGTTAPEEIPLQDKSPV
ncbi:uncharacterized protein LOC128674981 [Plodia interpunctella]|uniref:uncharacterized protein LOC128674981 n=1 Tax=Plodia interpunctella TaxID=58824 RepID=UPI002367D62A|nr:uncharacterized protein LOC128674981 [Plodia interpunctella]